MGVQHLTIFDFDLETEEIEANEVVSLISDAEVYEVFNELVREMKSLGNPYFQKPIFENPKYTKYLAKFKELGWIIENPSLEMNPEKVIYHTIDEVLELMITYVNELNARIDAGFIINWYEDTWKYWGKLCPMRLAYSVEEHLQKRREISRIFHQQGHEKNIAIKLGWKHYSTHEKSRGSISHSFSHKAYKKHLFPYLKTKIIEINDFDEMENFFKKSFFVGRWDWFSSTKEHPLPPRPSIERLTLSSLEIACLVEADETNVDEILKLVLIHSGKSGTSDFPQDLSEINIIPTYTIKDYQNSLTDADIDILLNDIHRLNRLSKTK